MRKIGGPQKVGKMLTLLCKIIVGADRLQVRIEDADNGFCVPCDQDDKQFVCLRLHLAAAFVCVSPFPHSGIFVSLSLSLCLCISVFLKDTLPESSALACSFPNLEASFACKKANC